MHLLQYMHILFKCLDKHVWAVCAITHIGSWRNFSIAVSAMHLPKHYFNLCAYN